MRDRLEFTFKAILAVYDALDRIEQSKAYSFTRGSPKLLKLQAALNTCLKELVELLED